MNARTFHQASQGGGATALFDPAAHGGLLPSSADRACCCVARAVVRAIMPPTPDRPHETELMLCGHHYRVSREALAAAHARVEELPGSRGDAGAWFHGDQGRSANVTAVAR